MRAGLWEWKAGVGEGERRTRKVWQDGGVVAFKLGWRKAIRIRGKRLY